jgi:hypothetical protein
MTGARSFAAATMEHSVVAPPEKRLQWGVLS